MGQGHFCPKERRFFNGFPKQFNFLTSFPVSLVLKVKLLSKTVYAVPLFYLFFSFAMSPGIMQCSASGGDLLLDRCCRCCMPDLPGRPGMQGFPDSRSLQYWLVRQNHHRTCPSNSSPKQKATT